MTVKDIFKRKKKRRYWPVVLFFFLFFSGLAGYGYYTIKHIDIADILENDFIQSQLQERVPEQYKSLLEMSPVLLGFEQPKTYVAVFQNDTELRPGGGFIGSYATLRVDKGNVTVLALEGTETLDRKTPDTWRPKPPAIMTKELGVDRWYFRDSNWDPFFVPNAKRALEFYMAEGGVAGENIDGFLAVDTQVLEELIALSGPITVQGITFTKENIVETLEYDVEYGFEKRGISFADRKQIMKPLFDAILKKIGINIITQPEKYIETIEKLIKEKHVAMYSVDEKIQAEMVNIGLSEGEPVISGDYLLWTDANLAALKTDHAMKRHLTYSLHTASGDNSIHTAKMTYTHTGVFDWRTSRYRTYARVFVPKGAELKEIIITEKNGRTKKISPHTATVEMFDTYQAFAYFFVIEPGDERSLAFKYQISSDMQLYQGKSYALTLPKQSGTDAHGLTLDLNFDKNISAAQPAEEKQEWGNMQYTVETDLLVDRVFEINF
jgi:hypothetical protein